MRRVGSWRQNLGGNAGGNAVLFRLAPFLRSYGGEYASAA